MQDWILVNIIVFFASLLQATTGFGFAIMSTPFLLLVYDSRDCIQLSILLSFTIALILTPKIWRDIHYGLLQKLIIGSIVGIPVGILLFIYMSLDLLKVFVGIVTLIVAGFSLVKWYKYRADGKLAESGVIIARSLGYGQWLAGVCSGILTTSIGMPGVPLALYFSVNNISKEIIRSTTLAFFIAVYALSIIAQALTVHIPNSVLWSSVKLIPAVVAGVICGHIVFPKVSQQVFQLVINIILLSTAFYLVAKQW